MNRSGRIDLTEYDRIYLHRLDRIQVTTGVDYVILSIQHSHGSVGYKIPNKAQHGPVATHCDHIQPCNCCRVKTQQDIIDYIIERFEWTFYCDQYRANLREFSQYLIKDKAD